MSSENLAIPSLFIELLWYARPWPWQWRHVEWYNQTVSSLIVLTGLGEKQHSVAQLKTTVNSWTEPKGERYDAWHKVARQAFPWDAVGWEAAVSSSTGVGWEPDPGMLVKWRKVLKRAGIIKLGGMSQRARVKVVWEELRAGKDPHTSWS